ncbi:butyrophilin subfamily 1 member A1-like isoform X3 [Marmota flaviventris]|uniref:butyrophilin subfamily 1 member A1-like isoform X3 n=1 Tax=Marmota flaviventris TaxID=93162 RepID=UPI003A84CD03
MLPRAQPVSWPWGQLSQWPCLAACSSSTCVQEASSLSRDPVHSVSGRACTAVNQRKDLTQDSPWEDRGLRPQDAALEQEPQDPPALPPASLARRRAIPGDGTKITSHCHGGERGCVLLPPQASHGCAANGASGQDPHIHVEPGPSGSFKLTCTSPGWYPEPEVQWSGPGQLQLEPASEANSVEGDGLFRVESSVSVEESSREHVTCSIRNPVLNEEKKGHVSMAGDLFTRVSPWTVVLAVFDVLVAVSLAVISAILMRTTKAKETLSEELEERSSIGGIDLEEARRYAGYLGTFCVMKCGFARLIFWDKLELARNLCPQLLPPCHSCKMILLSSSEDITLDADTAHPSLHVSHSGKHVETLPMKQDVPDKSARFTLAPFVLGQKSFSSGLHYWEVEVPDKYTWNVGLCLDSVKRKISYNYTSPENGFWSISRIDRRYDALSVPRFVVNVENPPLKIVGIFLQYEKGLISFYDVKASSILYTFKSKFTQPLKPYFSPGPHIPGEKQAFKILQVPGGSRFL